MGKYCSATAKNVFHPDNGKTKGSLITWCLSSIQSIPDREWRWTVWYLKALYAQGILNYPKITSEEKKQKKSPEK